MNNKQSGDGVYDDNIALPLLSVVNEFSKTAEVLGYARKPL